MFIQFGVDFASQICRFILCINYGKISASTEIFLFLCLTNLYICIRRLDFVLQANKCSFTCVFVCFSFSLCFVNRTIRNILVTSGEEVK